MGGDVPAILYGEKPLFPEQEGDANMLLRNITEFALIDYCLENDIPFAGICMGSQIINVYLGGKLVTLPDCDEGRQRLYPPKFFCNSEWQYMWDQLPEDVKATAEKIKNKKKWIFYSCHHQAIGYYSYGTRLGKGVLPLLISAEGVIKLSITQDGNILSQVHPEEAIEITIAKRIKKIPHFIENAKKFLSLLETSENIRSCSPKELSLIKEMAEIFRDEYYSGQYSSPELDTTEKLLSFIDSNKDSVKCFFEHIIKIGPNGIQDMLEMIRCAEFVFGFFLDQIAARFKRKPLVKAA